MKWDIKERNVRSQFNHNSRILALFIKKNISTMKKSVIIALMPILFHGIIYSQETNNQSVGLVNRGDL
ncbi:MAG: hypothetical protein BGP15_17890 [Sphingobacterium sp. 40-24]|jgi:hypothetical protein|nr:hypothetical protein [Sphingobacterium multivorum]OJZ07100.1 MAG: hypothetical protein BGP15_17890 [Sphingobacterium sp. 40-24]